LTADDAQPRFIEKFVAGKIFHEALKVSVAIGERKGRDGEGARRTKINRKSMEQCLVEKT